ncbi:DUF2147 domain-containing protein [Hyphomicrobium sp. D-2]|uniref:DUF2147 domain-containing protein n=1 Tax=Hyphomicrobium sp. D-2 TaxID=3041621 RepID=UPI0024563236|nr:DUF2147 domain-containing protein [Hyphomicrobium sp. D-2]MDH4982432.1 DUF2147 domain-containing protein [Hyphomicrobium sp. D-2]
MRHDLPGLTALKTLAGALVISVLFGCFSSVSAASPELGVWINHTGRGAVEIRPCAEQGPASRNLCGYIVWLKDPANKRGDPLTDGYNPDPTKRNRSICGLPVLGSLQRVSDGGWDNGWVYDPEQGASFDAAIKLANRDRLVLTGYKGIKLFSKSFTWKRAPDDLPRCDGVQQDARKKASAKTQEAKALPALKVPRPVPAVRPKPIEQSKALD